MTLFESFLTTLDNVFGAVVMVADALLPMAIIILLIVWLVQRSSVKSMIRMFGSDEAYDEARMRLRKRSRIVASIGWFLFAAGLVVLIGGLTWVTYIESNYIVTSMSVWEMSRYIMTYSVFAWLGGLCLVFSRFVYVETKSLRLLREWQAKNQSVGSEQVVAQQPKTSDSK